MEWSLELSLESTILEAKFLFHQKPGERGRGGNVRNQQKPTETQRFQGQNISGKTKKIGSNA